MFSVCLPKLSVFLPILSVYLPMLSVFLPMLFLFLFMLSEFRLSCLSCRQCCPSTCQCCPSFCLSSACTNAAGLCNACLQKGLSGGVVKIPCSISTRVDRGTQQCLSWRNVTMSISSLHQPMSVAVTRLAMLVLGKRYDVCI